VARPRLPPVKLHKQALRDRYWGEAPAGAALADRILADRIPAASI
jgi:hypothetical protein